jgi:hypothetical protein
MATIGNTYATLLDIAKRTDPNGGVASIIESLTLVNPVLQDMAWKEGNLVTGHRYTSRTALPSPDWRRFNEGIAPKKSVTEQYDETCGMLDGMSKVDVALAKLNGNEAAFRASEDQAFVQGFNIKVNNSLFYESIASTPAALTGLAPRFNSTTGTYGAQVIKADASASGADQSSIWLIGWSDKTVFGIYPKGSQMGLSHEDMGQQLTKDWAGTKEFRAYVTYWSWQLGLVVQDARFVSRICNIDTGNLTAAITAGADIATSMEDAVTAIYSLDVVNPVFYMNRLVFGMLQKQLVVKKTMDGLSYLGGERFARFRGIPIKITDAITSTESVVT